MNNVEIDWRMQRQNVTGKRTEHVDIEACNLKVLFFCCWGEGGALLPCSFPAS